MQTQVCVTHKPRLLMTYMTAAEFIQNTSDWEQGWLHLLHVFQPPLLLQLLIYLMPKEVSFTCHGCGPKC